MNPATNFITAAGMILLVAFFTSCSTIKTLPKEKYKEPQFKPVPVAIAAIPVAGGLSFITFSAEGNPAFLHRADPTMTVHAVT